MTLQRTEPLKPGVSGAIQTLRRMSTMILYAAKQDVVKMLAQRVIGFRDTTPPLTDAAYRATRIQEYVRLKALYTRDNWSFKTGCPRPGSWEKLVSPEVQAGQLLDTGFIVEDCDGGAMLVAALLLASGFIPAQVKLTIVATKKGRGLYNHVLTQGRIGDTWMALDTLSAYPDLEQTRPAKDWGLDSHG